jgi:hypothetical protein
VLAVAVLAAEQVRCELDGLPAGELSETSRSGLEQVPHATDWARSFNRDMRTTVKGFHRHGAPNTVRHAVVGIAHAYVPDPDAMLRELLVGAIEDCGPPRAGEDLRRPQASAQADAGAPGPDTGRLTVS